MSRTRKDAQNASTALEVVKRDDGTFDLLLNHKLDCSRIPVAGLRKNFACVRILWQSARCNSAEVNRDGRTIVVF